MILRDLGYYSHHGLHEITNKKACFISKVKPKTALFETTGQRLDLALLSKRIKKFGINCMEKQIRIGSENSLIAHAIISVVPDEIRKGRKQAVLNKAKNHQYTVQEQYHAWENLNVFITNIQDNLLSANQIMMLYRLRWQVELIFKTWKSHKCIDQYKTMKKDRMECYLYADLLLSIIQGKLFAWLN